MRFEGFNDALVRNGLFGEMPLDRSCNLRIIESQRRTKTAKGHRIFFMGVIKVPFAAGNTGLYRPVPLVIVATVSSQRDENCLP